MLFEKLKSYQLSSLYFQAEPTFSGYFRNTFFKKRQVRKTYLILLTINILDCGVFFFTWIRRKCNSLMLVKIYPDNIMPIITQQQRNGGGRELLYIIYYTVQPSGWIRVKAHNEWKKPINQNISITKYNTCYSVWVFISVLPPCSWLERLKTEIIKVSRSMAALFQWGRCVHFYVSPLRGGCGPLQEECLGTQTWFEVWI